MIKPDFRWASGPRLIWAIIASLAVAGFLATLLAFRTASQQTTGFVDRVYVAPDWEEYKYTLYVPPGYTAGTSYPLIVFLHGTHEKGDDGRSQIKVGLGPAIRQHSQQPSPERPEFLALFPQSWSGHWDPDSPDGRLVLDEVADVEAKYNVDRARIYLTGHSSGGAGTWALAARHPGRWAAIAPVCGWSDPGAVGPLRKIPCWCFHGGADRLLPPAVSRATVNALRQAGAKPRYTEYPGLDHNIWRKVYSDPEFYEWLLGQRLPTPPN